MKKSMSHFFLACITMITFKSIAANTSSYDQALHLNSKANLLFTQEAEQAAIVPLNKNTYQLILKDVSPKTVYFSDRPLRVSGEMNTKDFISDWNIGRNNFLTDPPNAVIDYSQKNQALRQLIIVKLTRPKYDATHQTLTYIIYSLNGKLTSINNMNKPTIYIDNIY